MSSALLTGGWRGSVPPLRCEAADMTAPGITIGKAFLFGREQYAIPRRPVKVDQIQAEIKRTTGAEPASK